jgi:hexosaminidase
MNKSLLTLLAVVVLGFSASAQAPALIPQPVSEQMHTGKFKLNKMTKIVVPAGDAEALRIGNLLAGMLSEPTGYPISVTTLAKPSNVIKLKLNKTTDPLLGEEGYKIKSATTSVTIVANDTKGLFYGSQTLLQLLPPDIESKQKVIANWSIPAVDITDYPRFGWRGLMLDVSRHFFSKQVVLNYIDEMAKYKYNVLHLHLADDEGWRVEIKSLPKLTSVGAWRVMRTGPFNPATMQPPRPGEPDSYGGFYTQDDIREIVKYAQDKFITILPEVDVPAHSLALIASYPNISCTGLQYPVHAGWDFYEKQDNVLCVANDSTYIVLDKIFTELAQLFPGKYIHVGGDEAYMGFWEKDPRDQALMKREGLKTPEELQGYFERKVEQIVESKGKKLIGWDEIVDGGLAPNATVMSWRGMEGGTKAAKAGHEVVMSPWGNTYLDLYQGDPLTEPHTYGRCLLADCYGFEPVPDSVDAKLILGGQGNLWTESVCDERQVQYMTWPRSMALAEVYWSPKRPRDYEEFVGRVETHFKRLDEAGVKHATSIYDPYINTTKEKNDTTFKSLRIELNKQIKGLDIYYTFDTTLPDNHSLKYNGTALTVPDGASEIKAITYRDGKPIGKMLDLKLKDLYKKTN